MKPDKEPDMREWQPIETAPRDGGFILVNPAFGNSNVPYQVYWHESKKFAGWMFCNIKLTAKPTHWMSLPKPPNEQAQSTTTAQATLPATIQGDIAAARVAFEEWYSEGGTDTHAINKDEDGYCAFSTQTAWIAYQASEARIMAMLEDKELVALGISKINEAAKNRATFSNGKVNNKDEFAELMFKAAISAIKQKLSGE